MRVGSHIVSLFYFPTRATHYPTLCNHSRTDRWRVRIMDVSRIHVISSFFGTNILKIFSVCLQVMILPPAWIKFLTSIGLI